MAVAINAHLGEKSLRLTSANNPSEITPEMNATAPKQRDFGCAELKNHRLDGSQKAERRVLIAVQRLKERRRRSMYQIERQLRFVEPEVGLSRDNRVVARRTMPGAVSGQSSEFVRSPHGRTTAVDQRARGDGQIVSRRHGPPAWLAPSPQSKTRTTEQASVNCFVPSTRTCHLRSRALRQSAGNKSKTTPGYRPAPSGGRTRAHYRPPVSAPCSALPPSTARIRPLSAADFRQGVGRRAREKADREGKRRAPADTLSDDESEALEAQMVTPPG